MTRWLPVPRLVLAPLTSTAFLHCKVAMLLFMVNQPPLCDAICSTQPQQPQEAQQQKQSGIHFVFNFSILIRSIPPSSHAFAVRCPMLTSSVLLPAVLFVTWDKECDTYAPCCCPRRKKSALCTMSFSPSLLNFPALLSCSCLCPAS